MYNFFNRFFLQNLIYFQQLIGLSLIYAFVKPYFESK